jgi:hypothetical protein
MQIAPDFMQIQPRANQIALLFNENLLSERPSAQR